MMPKDHSAMRTTQCSREQERDDPENEEVNEIHAVRNLPNESGKVVDQKRPRVNRQGNGKRQEEEG